MITSNDGCLLTLLIYLASNREGAKAKEKKLVTSTNREYKYLKKAFVTTFN